IVPFLDLVLVPASDVRNIVQRMRYSPLTRCVIFIVAAASAWLLLDYNRLVAARNSCQKARSEVDVQLKKRHDLIPNLLSAVAGEAAQEREMLEQVTSARSAALDALGTSRSNAAENDLERSLAELLARAEAYPTL